MLRRFMIVACAFTFGFTGALSAADLKKADASEKTHVIGQKNKAFSQSSITIKIGDTIRFENDDETSHNVFSVTEGQKFNLGIQSAGAKNQRTFDKPGEVQVRCAIHPKMKLTVKIEK